MPYNTLLSLHSNGKTIWISVDTDKLTKHVEYHIYPCRLCATFLHSLSSIQLCYARQQSPSWSVLLQEKSKNQSYSWKINFKLNISLNNDCLSCSTNWTIIQVLLIYSMEHEQTELYICIYEFVDLRVFFFCCCCVHCSDLLFSLNAVAANCSSKWSKKLLLDCTNNHQLVYSFCCDYLSRYAFWPCHSTAVFVFLVRFSLFRALGRFLNILEFLQLPGLRMA